MLPQKVVAGINRKEDQAFVWIYESYFTRILNAVKKITGGSFEAYDLTQDVFLALLEHREAFESLRKIYQYLYRAAVFQSEDHRKHQEVVKEHAPHISYYYKDLLDKNRNDAEINYRYNHLMYLATEKLPRVSKQVFLLYYTKNQRNKQIAKTLGISEKTVETHKTYAYKMLKMEVKKSGSTYFFTLTLLL